MSRTTKIPIERLGFRRFERGGLQSIQSTMSVIEALGLKHLPQFISSTSLCSSDTCKCTTIFLSDPSTEPELESLLSETPATFHLSDLLLLRILLLFVLQLCCYYCSHDLRVSLQKPRNIVIEPREQIHRDVLVSDSCF